MFFVNLHRKIQFGLWRSDLAASTVHQSGNLCNVHEYERLMPEYLRRLQNGTYRAWQILSQEHLVGLTLEVFPDDAIAQAWFAKR